MTLGFVASGSALAAPPRVHCTGIASVWDDTDVAHLYVVRTRHRSSLRAHLAAAGVATDIHYPVPDHLQLGAGRAAAPSLPCTERACEEVLSLPCYPELTDTEVDAVAAACNEETIRALLAALADIERELGGALEVVFVVDGSPDGSLASLVAALPGTGLKAKVLEMSRNFGAFPAIRACLIEALCVEAGRKQPFYVKLAVHDRGSATVRVDPMTHPERSEGVRDLVAHVGALLLRATPGGQTGATNLVLPTIEPELDS
jgi:hypothetical protein